MADFFYFYFFEIHTLLSCAHRNPARENKKKHTNILNIAAPCWIPCLQFWLYQNLFVIFFKDTKHNEEAEKRRAREIELAKVSIKKEDVDLIVEEMEISKTMAERTLREHAGNIVEALASLTN